MQRRLVALGCRWTLPRSSCAVTWSLPRKSCWSSPRTPLRDPHQTPAPSATLMPAPAHRQPQQVLQATCQGVSNCEAGRHGHWYLLYVSVRKMIGLKRLSSPAKNVHKPCIELQPGMGTSCSGSMEASLGALAYARRSLARNTLSWCCSACRPRALRRIWALSPACQARR